MESTLLKDMGQRLSLKRKQLGITQEKLAEQMQVSIQMISNMEQGKKAIRPENLVKVCNILNISADYVLAGKKIDKNADELTNKILNLSERDLYLVETIVDFLIENSQQ